VLPLLRHDKTRVNNHSKNRNDLIVNSPKALLLDEHSSCRVTSSHRHPTFARPLRSRKGSSSAVYAVFPNKTATTTAATATTTATTAATATRVVTHSARQQGAGTVNKQHNSTCLPSRIAQQRATRSASTYCPPSCHAEPFINRLWSQLLPGPPTDFFLFLRLPLRPRPRLHSEFGYFGFETERPGSRFTRRSHCNFHPGLLLD